MNSGVRKIQIGALTYNIGNALIIGIICAQREPKFFNGQKGEKKAVWNFTLKDFEDSINVSCWGSADFVQRLYDLFKVGDVVEITNPRVSMVPSSSSNALYNPTVSSSFQLTLDEHHSHIVLYSEDDSVKYRDLMHIPIKRHEGFLRLSDVFSYGYAMSGQFVNLLVAVRNVGEIRKSSSKKDSSELSIRDVVVMDQTHSEFRITLWNDSVNRADSWLPKQTTLFFADIKLTWSSYMNAITGTISPKTIITEDPKTPEAEALKKYAASAPIQSTAILDQASRIVDVSQINSVMTTAQLLERAKDGDQENKFTALLFAFVTQFDLDGPEERVVAQQCTSCSQIIEGYECSNLVCQLESQNSTRSIFNIRVDLSDHRGTIPSCRLTSPAAEKILKYSVEDFLRMNSKERTQLKWKFLLTRCQVGVLVLRPNAGRSKPSIAILSCSPAEPAQVSERLPLY